MYGHLISSIFSLIDAPLLAPCQWSTILAVSKLTPCCCFWIKKINHGKIIISYKEYPVNNLFKNSLMRLKTYSRCQHTSRQDGIAASMSTVTRFDFMLSPLTFVPTFAMKYKLLNVWSTINVSVSASTYSNHWRITHQSLVSITLFNFCQH